MRKTKFDSLWDNINKEKIEFGIGEPKIKSRKNLGSMNFEIPVEKLFSSILKIIIKKCF